MLKSTGRHYCMLHPRHSGAGAAVVFAGAAVLISGTMTGEWGDGGERHIRPPPPQPSFQTVLFTRGTPSLECTASPVGHFCVLLLSWARNVGTGRRLVPARHHRWSVRACPIPGAVPVPRGHRYWSLVAGGVLTPHSAKSMTAWREATPAYVPGDAE